MIRRMQTAIETKLRSALNPAVLQVTNQSHMHRGHAGVQGSTSSETHFDIVIVSESFTGMSRLERHRTVNRILKEEFDQGLHAAAIKCSAPTDP